MPCFWPNWVNLMKSLEWPFWPFFSKIGRLLLEASGHTGTAGGESVPAPTSERANERTYLQQNELLFDLKSMETIFTFPFILVFYKRVDI